jgi:hypothetical protein
VPAAVKAIAEAVEYGTAPATAVSEAFVPPFAKASVPAKVTAPLVAVLGVNPVVPALNVVTPDAGAGCQEGKPAVKVKM